MSLAKGFESGFGLALSVRKLQQDEEDRKLKREQFALDKAVKEEQIEAAKVQREIAEEELAYTPEKRKLEQQQTQAIIESNKANTLYREALASGSLARQKREELEDEKSAKAIQFKTALAIIDDLSELPDDPEARNTYIGNSYAAIEKLQREGFDFVNLFSAETGQAFKNLQPMFDSGDFSQIGQHVDDINQVFKPDFRQFVGKKFTDKDGRVGKIVDVRFDGTVQAKGEGRDANLGAMFEVEFEDRKMVDVPNQVPRDIVSKETEMLFSYVPESKKEVVQDLDGSDAKNVSIAEATDKLASLRTLTGLAIKNPNLLLAAKSYGELSLIDLEGKDPSTYSKAETDRVTARNIYSNKWKSWNETYSEAIKDSGMETGSRDPEQIDQFIRIFSLRYPDLELEADDDGLFIIPERYEDNLGKYIAQTEPDYVKTAEMVKSVDQPPNPNQLLFYSFGKTQFAWNAPKEEYLPYLERVYGENRVKKAVQDAEEYGANDSERLLDYLYYNLYSGR